MHIQHCTMYITFYIVQIVPHNVTTANPSSFLSSAHFILLTLDIAVCIFHVLSLQHCTSHFTLCPPHWSKTTMRIFFPNLVVFCKSNFVDDIMIRSFCDTDYIL